MRLRRIETSILKFYAVDLFKLIVKVLVGHPDRRRPSYRDWESRTQRATFDCSRAKATLGWRPVSDRAELISLGIEAPLRDLLHMASGVAFNEVYDGAHKLNSSLLHENFGYR